MDSKSNMNTSLSSNMPPVQEDDASSSKHSRASSITPKVSKVASMKKKLGFFKRKKNKESAAKTRISGQNSSGDSGHGDDQAASSGVSNSQRRSSSLSGSEEDHILSMDKFGVIIEDTATIINDKAENVNNSIHTGRPKTKGGKALSKPPAPVADNFSGPTIALMKKFARNGLPDPNIRHRAWTILTGIDNIIVKREGEYDALVGKSRVDMKQIQESLMGGMHRTEWGIIERDLKRTLPHHYLFREMIDSVDASGDFLYQDKNKDDEASEEWLGVLGKLSNKANKDEGYGKKALRRILRAYSVYDGEVGYCQGMNFIAAMFLTFLPEEESFWMLATVINEDPYKLRDLFSQDMAGTHEVLYIADNLVSQFLPVLYEHLENEQVHTSMFATQWLMTIYTSTFPFELVARVWDSFLCDGWIVVYRTMLALLESIQQELLIRNMDQILSYLRSFPSLVNGTSIMETSSNIPLKQNHIQTYSTEFRSLIKSDEIRVEEILQSRFARSSPDSLDGFSMTSSRATLPNFNKVHRFVAKLKRSTRETSIEDLSSKLVPVVGKPKFAVLISNVLSPEECIGLIKRAKGEQFEDVLMRRSGTSGNEASEIASCRRSMVEDLDLASELFNRLESALQGTELENKLHHAPWMSEGDASALNTTGLNDRLHFLRYGTGQFFAPHRDSRFKRGNEISHITMQVFLNNNFNGGTTSFRGGKRFLDVKPKTGSILLFDQDLRREECEVLTGRKFIVRSDVMFENTSS